MTDHAAIHIDRLVRRYGHTDAVNGLTLEVKPGRCYGFFGRNGAGKTTTIKCLLNLLRPTSGTVRVFGLDPRKAEVAVKSRIAYVPDYVAFYPWMTVRQTLDYFAAFRARWNRATESALLERFRLDPGQNTTHLSKGQRTQLALITAICAEPELLVHHDVTADGPLESADLATLLAMTTDGVALGRSTTDELLKYLFARAAEQPALLALLGTAHARAAKIADPEAVLLGLLEDQFAAEALCQTTCDTRLADADRPFDHHETVHRRFRH